MNHLKFALIAALSAGSTLAMAEQMSANANTTREERMENALQNYRSKNPNPGPAARAEESMKRGAHKAGNAIERGARATGNAVKKGAHKTGEAIEHVGEKIQGTTSNKP